MLRILNVCVIAALVFAAVHVYRIKYASTLQAEQVTKKHVEIRREREAIATLKAEWTKLDTPERIEELAKRHLKLEPMQPTQVDNLDHLPERPPDIVPPGSTDPIAALLEIVADPDVVTGTLPARPKR